MADVGRIAFPGRLVMLGFGSIGQAALPLLGPTFAIDPARITIVKPEGDATGLAARHGAAVVGLPLDQRNYRAVLAPLLAPGDFLLNVSVDVSSLALVALCRERGAFYLDTCNEPWAGVYDDPRLTPSQRSNYALREQALAWAREHAGGPTAVLTQGANPGLVSAFVKRALLDMAAQTGQAAQPESAAEWARLAQRLHVKVIHIAERDTQTASRRKQHDEFVNTWSVRAFIDEGLQPAELGWGTHERHWPADGGRHGFGGDAAIWLNRPGFATPVRSWTPLEGPYHGFLVTHAESISIADHLTMRERGAVVYRPTVNYAYHPCDDAVLSIHELAGRHWRLNGRGRGRVIRDDIDAGLDEMGVLLMGHPRGVYWYGSRLWIDEARRLAPNNNATSLQVVAGILGGMTWALRHPDAGLVEPDDLDHETVLEAAQPYLGTVVGEWSDWTPLQGRSTLFAQEADERDPWQFPNFRVA